MFVFCAKIPVLQGKELRMSKKSIKIKNDCMKVLQSANVVITCSRDTEYYFVLRMVYYVSQDNVHKFEMDIEPRNFGMSRYTITMADGQKFSCLARPDAVFFHRPVADNALEVFREVRLRYLIQNTQQKK